MTEDSKTLAARLRDLIDEDRLDEAQSLFDSIPEAERDYGILSQEVRLCFAQSERKDTALLNRAVLLLNNLREGGLRDPHWHFRRGWAFYHLSRYEEAREAFKQCSYLVKQGEHVDDARIGPVADNFAARSEMQILLRDRDTDYAVVKFAQSLDPEVRRGSWFLVDNYVRALINITEYPDTNGVFDTIIEELEAVEGPDGFSVHPVFWLRKGLAYYWSDRERLSAEAYLHGIRLCDEDRGNAFMQKVRLALLSNLDQNVTAVARKPWTKSIPETLAPNVREMRLIGILKTLADRNDWHRILELAKTLPPEKTPLFAALLIARTAYNLSIVEQDLNYVHTAFRYLDAQDDFEKEHNPIWMCVKSSGFLRLNEFGEAYVLAEKARRILIDGGLMNPSCAEAVENALVAKLAMCEKTHDAKSLLEFIESIPAPLHTHFVKREHARTLLNTAEIPDVAGKLPQAEKLLREVPQHERNTSWLMSMGRIALYTYRAQEALKLFREAVGTAAQEGADKYVRDGIEHFVRESETAVKLLGNKKFMDDEAFKAYCKEIENELGPITQVIDGWYPIRLLVVSSKRHVNEQYLVTAGLSYVQGETDLTNPNNKPCELILTIDESRRMDDYAKDIVKGWPATLLGRIAKTMMLRPDVSVKSGSTFAVSGKHIVEGSDYSAVMLYAFWHSDELSEKFSTHLLEMIPLYVEEFEFAGLFSANKLFERMRKIPWRPVPDSRPKASEKSDYSMLIPQDKIRQVYETKGPSQAIVSMKILHEGLECGYFYREKPDPNMAEWDSGWFFFSGTETKEYLQDSSNFPLVELNTVCNYIPDVMPYLDADYGTRYVKGKAGYYQTDELPAPAATAEEPKPLLS